MHIVVDRIVSSKLWNKDKSVTLKSYLKNVVKQSLSVLNLSKYITDVEFSFVFTDDDTIRQLNKEYRKKDKPTNVLSIPNEDLRPKYFANMKENDNGYLILGDIIISYETCEREALLQEKKFKDHVTHLLIHSILHLFGYDHITENDAKIMEDLEDMILLKFEIILDRD